MANVGFELYVKTKKKKKFEGVYNEEAKKEKAFELGAGIEASSYISLTTGTSFGKEDNFDIDFYFSGVTLKVWVKAGFGSQSNEIIKIIPELKKDFDVLKNKGEYK